MVDGQSIGGVARSWTVKGFFSHRTPWATGQLTERIVPPSTRSVAPLT